MIIPKRRVIKVLLLLMAAPALLSAQDHVNRRSHRMDRELRLTYDNDFLFFTDQYYSSGVNIALAKILKYDSPWYNRLRSKKTDSSKVILRYHYGNQIHTPSDIKSVNIELYDRPYGGWHYGKIDLLNFPKSNAMNRYSLEVGLIGNWSGIGNFQTWWHDQFGIARPRGWKNEVANELVVNLAYNRMYNFKLFKGLDVVSNTGAKFGNGRNHLSQEIVLRAHEINPLSNSAIYGSRLSNEKPNVDVFKKEHEEGYFFYGIRGQYAFSDILIEGSLFNENSIHTEELDKLQFARFWGFTYSNYYTTFTFTSYYLTKETKDAHPHKYLTVSLAFRF